MLGKRDDIRGSAMVKGGGRKALPKFLKKPLENEKKRDGL
jgi:hypothetical protein